MIKRFVTKVYESIADFFLNNLNGKMKWGS